LGKPAAENVPGSRSSASSWTDREGNLWLFGGDGFDSKGVEGYLNDLWEFQPSISEWAWMGGSDTVPAANGGQPGVYGKLGTPAAGNIPGSRYGGSSWTDSSGKLWLFGGTGIDTAGGLCTFNDLWEFDSATDEWAWMGGTKLPNPDGDFQSGVYGTFGMPAIGASAYDLHLSAVAPGGYDLYLSGHITGTSTTVNGLPTNGERFMRGSIRLSTESRSTTTTPIPRCRCR
jgi:N-acetylneuraminic acid mutarotase